MKNKWRGDDAESEIRKLFKSRIRRGVFFSTLTRLQKYITPRDNTKNYLVMQRAQFRNFVLALGNRLKKEGFLETSDDIAFLTMGTLRESGQLESILKGEVSQAESRKWVRNGKETFARWAETESMPDILTDQVVSGPEAVKDVPSEVKPPHDLVGVGISPGRISGRVRVIRSPREFYRMRKGEILVAPLTDPSWTPLFPLAKGVIVEIGGTLSHAAIVAREYGIPAVANVRNATQILKDGDLIEVDGYSGRLSNSGSSGGARALTNPD